MFKVELGNPAKRFLKKCDKQLYERLMTQIRILATDPFPSDVKRVAGRKEKVFRIRVGDYRIQYVIFHEESLILIADVDRKESAYD